MKTLTFPILLSQLILIPGYGDKDIIKGIDVSGYVLEYGTWSRLKELEFIS